MSTIKPIETVFDGYRFRSRLEARWATFLKTAGIPYQYEPEGFDLGGLWYLPDFWLPDQDCWMEIKGQELTADETTKAERLALHGRKTVHVFVGPPWFSIARHTFARDKDNPGTVRDYACFEPDMLRDYDWPDKREYYQGWNVWLIEYPSNRIVIGCLVESCDARGARDERIVAAYEAARSARFEHGETPR